MTFRVDFDRRLNAWLDEGAAVHAPGELHARFIEGMETARQRPGWATTERWITMETRAQLGAVPRLVVVMLTIVVLTALAAGTYAIGSSLTSTGPNGVIVYQHASGDLWAVNPDVSDPHPLVESDAVLEVPSWSPDGTRLACWSTAAGAMDLVVSDADGSDPVVVASDVGEVLGWGQADWSPDGTRLAFTARPTVPSGDETCLRSVGGEFCGSRVYVAAADGSTGAVQVGDPDLDAREATWSPDGSSLAFGAGSAAQDIRLHVMDADGSNVRAVSDLQGEAWALYRLTWSPDGRRVAGTSGLPVWDIWSFEVDGGQEANVSGPSFAVAEEADRLFPTYAADGALAWSGGWSGDACGCLTLREGDADPVALPGFSDALTWSPDGRFIVTGSAERPGELVVIDRQGQVQAAIDIGASEMVSWQPLG